MLGKALVLKKCPKSDIHIFQVEKRLNEESERAKHYLDPSTEKPVTEV